MTKILFQWTRIFMCLSVVLLTGCGLKPINREFEELGGNPLRPSQVPGVGKVVFLNESPIFYLRLPTINAVAVSRSLSDLAGTAKVNVVIGNKGVGQLDLTEYAAIMVPYGDHQIALTHWDLVEFKSLHQLVVDKPFTFVLVNSTLVSNDLLVTEPKFGLDEYRAAPIRK